MPRRDPRVTAYIQSCAPFARPILRQLRTSIHAGGPAIEEAIKWGKPGFMYRGKIVCGIAAFKEHCALWFWQGKNVVGKKPPEGMGHFGRITNTANVPSPAKVKGYVRKAMQLIDQER